jgi:hypothetical protein
MITSRGRAPGLRWISLTDKVAPLRRLVSFSPKKVDCFVLVAVRRRTVVTMSSYLGRQSPQSSVLRHPRGQNGSHRRFRQFYPRRKHQRIWPVDPCCRVLQRHTAVLQHQYRGTGATATVGASGHYAFAQPVAGFSPGWSHIVAAGAGGLLFYNASTRTGATAIIDDTGNFASVDNISGFGQWTLVVGIFNGRVFFYNAEARSGTIALIDQNGHYFATGDAPSDFGDWRMITAA